MLNTPKLIGLAYDYVLFMSQSKKYNAQTLANVCLLEKLGKKEVVKILQRPLSVFAKNHHYDKVRDFVYKSDYFTPRNIYLINPLFYVYYTYLAFTLVELFLKDAYDLDFSKENMKIFYSGFLSLESSKDEIRENSKFNKSYNLFQEERKKYFGNPVLKIDIQDFFNSIKVNSLINKLNRLLGPQEIIDQLEYFFNYCKLESLPQFHYSIASSILSQIYLNDFDSKMSVFTRKENLHLIRFVDDMFIVHLDGREDRNKDNYILNEISYFLWQDELVLNTSKTKILTSAEYADNYELVESEYEEMSSFFSERLVEERAEEIIDNGEFILLIDKLCKLEKSDGMDLKEYKNLITKHISIEGEDSNKVINNIIFSGKWKNLEVNNLKKIVHKWKYILFNPNQFTVLYIMVYQYLEEIGAVEEKDVQTYEVLDYLFKSKGFNFRDSLVAVSYLFQNNLRNQELLDKIKEINPNYVEFIRTYISR
ncbi:RNA-directed DNA polymerase [Priestia megaterium]